MHSNHLAVWSQSYFNCESLCWVVIWEDLSRVDWQGLPGAQGSPLQGLYSHSWGWDWFQRLATVSKWNLLPLIHLTSDVLSWAGGKGQSASVCARKTAFILGHPQRALARWPRVSATHVPGLQTPRSRLPSILYTANPHAIVWWGSKVPLPCC